MRVVLQRVTAAAVRVDGQVVGQIGRGYLVLVGFAPQDTPQIADGMAQRLAKLRIFADDTGRINLNAAAVDGQLLAVPQFTLCADTRQNRPGFSHAAKPELASGLFDGFVASCKPLFARVEAGVFGADMQVEIHNDGPFTLVLDS